MNHAEQLGKIVSAILLNEPMKNHTSLKVGGSADMFLKPADRLELIRCLKYLKQNDLPYFILGAGTNILVSDEGIEGAVIDVKTALNRFEIDSSNLFVKAEAGVRLTEILKASEAASMHGLEFLHGIPGCVGGAVFMNAGTKFGYIGDICESVEILDHDLSQWNISSNSLNFGYRCSGIEENTIILSATLKLKEGTSSRAMEIKMQLDRKRKTAHPAGVPSAGCFFRNPSHSMPAGRLIELAGLKGLRTGSAEISTVHANFLINRGDARAKDFISLIRIIRNKVYAQYNIKLDLEVKLVGRNIHDPF